MQSLLIVAIRPRGEQMFLLNMLMYKLIYLMDMTWISVWWWWLRSIIGTYGRHMIEVAYREMIFSLHRGCMGDDSLGRVVGCPHDASPMFDIPGLTPVWAPCISFFDFQDIKTYTYVYIVFKPIWNIKEHWWSLTLS